jgi:hypothetical protein
MAKHDAMISKEQKRRIRTYSPAERSLYKAARRRADAAESALGRAGDVQERNRALPHASQFKFQEGEQPLPIEQE